MKKQNVIVFGFVVIACFFTHILQGTYINIVNRSSAPYYVHVYILSDTGLFTTAQVDGASRADDPKQIKIDKAGWCLSQVIIEKAVNDSPGKTIKRPHGSGCGNWTLIINADDTARLE